MRIIFIAILSFSVLFTIWRLILKRLNDKYDYHKVEAQIIGKTTIKEIEEIEFLLKYFKGHYPPHWRTQIKEKILDDRFHELIKKYPIKNED